MRRAVFTGWLIVCALLAAACTAADDAPGESSGGAAGAGIGGASGASGAGAGGTSGAGGAPSAGSSGASSGGAGGGAGGASGGGASGSSGASGAGSGGAAGAGGEADGGPGGSDASADAGGGVDRCATALFCETFESYPTGNAPNGDWQAQTNHGAVSVVEDEKFAGSKSARFATEQNSGGKTAFIRLDGGGVFPIAGNAYFGRMMFRLESAPEESVHWTFIQSGGVVPGQSYHALYRYGGQHPVTDGSGFVGNQLMANYETPDSYGGNGPSSDCWFHADEVEVPTGRWACVEWQFDGPSDTMRMWLDGQPIDSLTMTGLGQGCVHQDASYPWTAPTFENLQIGWESYQSDDARTLYIDDVVIDTAQVGCPPPP